MRRNLPHLLFVSLLAIAVYLAGFPRPEKAFVLGYSGGWNHYLVDDAPSFGEDFPPEWVDAGAGKTRLLYLDYEAVVGRRYVPRNQTDAPSCVGHAMAAAIDFLMATDVTSGQPERFMAAGIDASTLYGLSRYEIAKLKYDQNISLFAGSTCEWACEAVYDYGTLLRRDYGLLGIDLTHEDPDRDTLYGREGCPDALEFLAALHPVRRIIRISSYEQARDAIYRGCPIIVGSSQGFGSRGFTRDSEGFLNPPRRGPGTRWYHAMVVIAVVDSGRPGVLFLNSWGPDWVTGPQRFGNEPRGSFFVDSAVFDRMAKEDDTFAISSFIGYPLYRLW